MKPFQVVKNTFGISSVLNTKAAILDKLGTFSGSSITRLNSKRIVSDIIRKPLETEPCEEQEFDLKPKKIKNRKPRKMSQRTKSKIRRKIIAFSMVAPKLSFLTLTFCNKVDDRTAYKAFRTFMDNAKKRLPDLEYIWVVERQTENAAFLNNPHFHVINNRYWEIKKWWPYWLDIQAKFGIRPRDENYKPSSAFDVRHVKGNNLKGIVNYMTKYVTKNEGEFDCQVWNCTKRVSRLYTDFYTDETFIENLEKLESGNVLGGDLKRVQLDWVKLFLVPLNQITMKLYERLRKINLEIWNNPIKSKIYAIQPPKFNFT